MTGIRRLCRQLHRRLHRQPAPVLHGSAEVRWKRQLDGGDPAQEAEAAFQLAGLAAADGRFEDAVASYVRAVRTGDPVVTPRAHFELGRLWSRKPDPDRAEEAFAAALAASRLEDTPDVIVNVARERARQGRRREACDLYRAVLTLAGQPPAGDRVADARRSQLLAFTALWLGEALHQLGDEAGAEQEWRRALADNDRGASPRAALLLATELPKGRLASTEVEALLGLAQYFDHPEISPRAALLLADLLESKQMRSDADELRKDVALHSGRSQAASEARIRLANPSPGGAATSPAPRPDASPARPGPPPRRRHRVLVLGAGTVGQDLVRELEQRSHAFDVLGFLDDAPKPPQIAGAPVVGPLRLLGAVLDRRHADEVLFTIPCAPGRLRRAALHACRDRGIPLRTLPNIFELLPDRPLYHQLREARIDELYERTPVTIDRRARVVVRGRAVLITGAGGVLGGELARQIAGARPKLLVLLDRSDGALAELDRELIEDRHFVHSHVVVTDCGQPHRIEEVMKLYAPELIFHAAGYDHADVLEPNALEAVRNNVLATRTLASSAGVAGVERFILVSSDAAAAPRGLFGSSKLLAELVMEEQQATHPDTTFAALRIGEVFNAPGSIAHRFDRQIRRGGPVTVTSPDAERRYLPAYLAAQWLLRVAEVAQGGQLFTLEAGESIRTIELAHELVRLHGWEPGEDVELIPLAPRPGEAAASSMLGSDERPIRTDWDGLCAVLRGQLPGVAISNLLDRVEGAVKHRSVEELYAVLRGVIPVGPPDEERARVTFLPSLQRR
jgi:FlaA1/EpsC-like NDP-sugar epimerase/tetratricopeptide (TPR) repeat protein